MPLRYLTGYNGYPISALAALLLHALALGFILYWNTTSDSSELELVQPTVIKTLFIDENPQVRERRRIEQLQVQRRRDEALEQQRREEALRQQRLIEREELERLEREARLREEEEARERQRLLDEQRARELAEQAEREREREALLREQERERLEREALQLAQLQQEAAAAAARTEFEVVQSGVALIQQIVQENWSRPPSARNGMRAVLRINMLPTGEVTDVIISESSGDPTFDRSAETAVYRAQPFSELQQMPIHIFNGNFRTLSLIFQPEDLLN